jgi:hypothetical protein
VLTRSAAVGAQHGMTTPSNKSPSRLSPELSKFSLRGLNQGSRQKHKQLEHDLTFHLYALVAPPSRSTKTHSKTNLWNSAAARGSLANHDRTNQASDWCVQHAHVVSPQSPATSQRPLPPHPQQHCAHHCFCSSEIVCITSVL